MVTEEVGIAEPQRQLVQSRRCHVSSVEVVQSGGLYIACVVNPLQYGSREEPVDGTVNDGEIVNLKESA